MCSLQPPIVILNCLVAEAEALEAKDANGFSDPYCMLGIRPALAISTQQQAFVGTLMTQVNNYMFEITT